MWLRSSISITLLDIVSACLLYRPLFLTFWCCILIHIPLCNFIVSIAVMSDDSPFWSKSNSSSTEKRIHAVPCCGMRTRALYRAPWSKWSFLNGNVLATSSLWQRAYLEPPSSLCVAVRVAYHLPLHSRWVWLHEIELREDHHFAADSTWIPMAFIYLKYFLYPALNSSTFRASYRVLDSFVATLPIYEFLPLNRTLSRQPERCRRLKWELSRAYFRLWWVLN